MTGIYIHPSALEATVPGQVPGLQSPLSDSRLHQLHILETPAQRRQILHEVIRRNAATINKSDQSDNRLKTQIQKLLVKAGKTGLRTSALTHLIQQHGKQPVASALRSLGTETHQDRIYILAKTLPSPVGDKKIWNNRVVEKKPDGKWHVIGSASQGQIKASKAPAATTPAPTKPGTDSTSAPTTITSAPAAAPGPLEPHTLSKPELLHLLMQLVRIHQSQSKKED